MKVRVGIQGISETLHKRHGSTLCCAKIQQFVSATAQQSRSERIRSRASIETLPVKKLAVITWEKAYLLQNGPGALAANLRAHRGLNAYQRIGMAEKNNSL